MNKFLLNWIAGIHILSSMSGAGIGGYEVYMDNTKRIFSEKNDNIYQGSARGGIRGLGYLYRTALVGPKVWAEEKDNFWKEK